MIWDYALATRRGLSELGRSTMIVVNFGMVPGGCFGAE
jgi:hypothetical protein